MGPMVSFPGELRRHRSALTFQPSWAYPSPLLSLLGACPDPHQADPGGLGACWSSWVGASPLGPGLPTHLLLQPLLGPALPDSRVLLQTPQLLPHQPGQVGPSESIPWGSPTEWSPALTHELGTASHPRGLGGRSPGGMPERAKPALRRPLQRWGAGATSRAYRMEVWRVMNPGGRLVCPHASRVSRAPGTRARAP